MLKYFFLFYVYLGLRPSPNHAGDPFLLLAHQFVGALASVSFFCVLITVLIGCGNSRFQFRQTQFALAFGLLDRLKLLVIFLVWPRRHVSCPVHAFAGFREERLRGGLVGCCIPGLFAHELYFEQLKFLISYLFHRIFGLYKGKLFLLRFHLLFTQGHGELVPVDFLEVRSLLCDLRILALLNVIFHEVSRRILALLLSSISGQSFFVLYYGVLQVLLLFALSLCQLSLGPRLHYTCWFLILKPERPTSLAIQGGLVLAEIFHRQSGSPLLQACLELTSHRCFEFL